METAISLFGQTAAISSTVALVANTTSLFLVCVYLVCSVSGNIGDNTQLFINWSDDVTTQEWFSDELQLETLGNLVNSPVFVIRVLNNGTITYSTSYNAYMSPAYDLFLTIKAIP
jgi:hypothetical protein